MKLPKQPPPPLNLSSYCEAELVEVTQRRIQNLNLERVNVPKFSDDLFLVIVIYQVKRYELTSRQRSKVHAIQYFPTSQKAESHSLQYFRRT